jgi:hypothetical protein
MFSGFNVVYSDKAGLGVTYKIMSTRFILATGYACMFYFADRQLKELARPVGNEFPLPNLCGCYRRHVICSHY